MSVTYKALLIGNNVFPDDEHNLPPLKGPINDVTKLKEALCDPRKGLYKEEHVTVLANETKDRILEAMETFFENASRKDQILFYYSGHGFIDGTSELYLCAKNTTKKNILRTGVANYYLNKLLYRSASQKRIIILDCCNSGNFKGGDLPTLLKGEGRFVLTSTRVKELARDAEDEHSPSPFTKYLIEGLLNDEIDTNHDGYVSIGELYNYISPRLHDETKQYPNKKFHDTYGDLPMCKRIGIAKSAKEQNKSNPPPVKPRLEVSTNNIDHRDVGYHEELPNDIIYIHNSGGGQLDWSVETEFDWIKLTKSDDNQSFSVQYKTTKVGRNRGKIRVHDRNGGGSREIRVLVEKLPQEQKETIQAPTTTNQYQTSQKRNTQLIKSFTNVTMRYPTQATKSVDNTEKNGTLQIYEDRIEHVSNTKYILSNITSVTYYPQEINPNNVFNYMSIKGETIMGEQKEMYFYSFNWLVSGQTWNMIEEIYGYIVNGRIKTANNFSSHMERDSRLHSKKTPLPPQNQTQFYFPGTWTIRIYTFGQVISTLHLTFFANGTLTGSQQSTDGQSTVNGTWAFTPNGNQLTYFVNVTFFNGMVSQDQGTVSLSISPQNSIIGRDHLARKWELFKTSG